MKSMAEIRVAQPDRYQSVEVASFAFFDIETTGLHPDRGAKITEIAILPRSGQRFHWTQPENDIGDKYLSEQLSAVLAHLTTGVVVGHNVGFDLRFIAYETERLGFRGPDVLYIDTLGLARNFCNNTKDYTLSSLLNAFDISIKGPLHTAIVDARATRALFWKLINYGNIETLAQAGMQRLNWSTF
jgi:DNA polymerase III epsilon subunit-like protein